LPETDVLTRPSLTARVVAAARFAGRVVGLGVLRTLVGLAAAAILVSYAASG
jgi:hypothetical protein